MGEVSFSGYYGMSNYGDDLFAITCCLASKQYLSFECKLVAPEMLGVESNCLVSSRLARFYSSLSPIGAALRAFFKIKAVAISSVMVLGGGSTVSPRPPKVYEAAARLFSGHKILMGLGLSVEPVDVEGYHRLKYFLGTFNLITLRDQASFEYVTAMGLCRPRVVMARDLVGALPLFVPFKARKDCDVIGLAPCNYESYFGGDLIAEKNRNEAVIGAVVSYAKKSGKKVRLYSLNNHPVHGDDELVESYFKKLVGEGIATEVVANKGGGALEVWHSIASCQMFLSVRLHGAITAYLAEVPFGLIEYHKKCTEFLHDIQLEPQFRVEKISTKAIEALLERLESSWTGCGIAPSQYSAEAKTSFIEMREALQGLEKEQ